MHMGANSEDDFDGELVGGSDAEDDAGDAYARFQTSSLSKTKLASKKSGAAMMGGTSKQSAGGHSSARAYRASGGAIASAAAKYLRGFDEQYRPEAADRAAAAFERHLSEDGILAPPQSQAQSQTHRQNASQAQFQPSASVPHERRRSASAAAIAAARAQSRSAARAAANPTGSALSADASVSASGCAASKPKTAAIEFNMAADFGRFSSAEWTFATAAAPSNMPVYSTSAAGAAAAAATASSSAPSRAPPGVAFGIAPHAGSLPTSAGMRQYAYEEGDDAADDGASAGRMRQ
jgi:hypothetical protein